MKRLHTYSQHFLRSPRLVHELIGHSNIKKRDLVLDLGAGSGVISSVLSKRAGRVIAVENEPMTAKKLRANMARFANVTVIEGDIMQVVLPSEPYKVFANIPFYLSSGLVSHLTHATNPPSSIYLIVQKQFARKLLPDHDGFSSQLGMMIGPWWHVRIRRPLKKTDFWPFPAVDTVLVEIKQRNVPLLPLAQRSVYEAFVERCFTDPTYYRDVSGNQGKPSGHVLDDWVKLYRQA